jgi:signal transduction histidine kinase
VEVEEDMPLRTLSAEQRRNIFLVVKEALHNVVKHAAANQVLLGMAWREGALDVRISDDGPGPPAHAEATEGNGVRNMGRRIAALGGTLTLARSTEPDLPGACLRFRVPMDAPP